MLVVFPVEERPRWGSKASEEGLPGTKWGMKVMGTWLYRKWSDSGSVSKGEPVGLPDRVGVRRRKEEGGRGAFS